MAEPHQNMQASCSDSEGGGDEGIVTMVDVLEAEEELEENAEAVLGPADFKNCTYHNENYFKRQPIYVCLTCLAKDVKYAGFCLACSYWCHGKGDHNLMELYTKRNFRCDCGNSLFKSKCTLEPAKSEQNETNLYGHNFEGKYCTCDQPEGINEDGEMFQCIICEDWSHKSHMGSDVPPMDAWAEMMCGTCTDKLPFMKHYLGYAVNKGITCDENEQVSNVSIGDGSTAIEASEDIECSAKKIDDSSEMAKSGRDELIVNTLDNKELKEIREAESSIGKSSTGVALADDKNDSTVLAVHTKDTPLKNPETLKRKREDSEKPEGCLLKHLKALPRLHSGATYWPSNFRQLLCKCAECLETYKSLKVEYLTDETDTIEHYERQKEDRKASPSRYDKGMEALNSLGHVQKMEAILGYNDLKAQLTEYLAKFAEEKKVVTKEDITTFFDGMHARKKPKMDFPV